MAKSLPSNNLWRSGAGFPPVQAPDVGRPGNYFATILWDYQARNLGADLHQSLYLAVPLWLPVVPGPGPASGGERFRPRSRPGPCRRWVPGPRADLCRQVLAWLRDECGVADPAIERADSRLAAELAGHPEFVVEPTRDHFDYVYRTHDLIKLAGGKYHAQRNHINSLARSSPLPL